eukprot:gnl/TRDRNA2_/TRDRNA2_178986_c0_seq1.p1 gnl/TRDRNA2_/TRDRNA2_178986_c0~~gnl/TRDRNA2_/TRDRNA2_178986_c0_seq1.p1  ORF type:complete len:168 (+),score=26.40 gnl/TRDRNA2_/TRDRNA2_178986_c0_seq1:54-506(+)
MAIIVQDGQPSADAAARQKKDQPEEKASRTHDEISDDDSLVSTQASVDNPNVAENDKKVAASQPSEKVAVFEPTEGLVKADASEVVGPTNVIGSQQAKHHRSRREIVPRSSPRTDASTSSKASVTDVVGPVTFSLAHLPPVAVVLLIVLI